MKLEKTLYTAHAKATGGREGVAQSSDGALNVKLSTPRELGGGSDDGTNPEQLFAAGYAACFIGAMNVVARGAQIALPKDVSIASSVGIGPVPGGFSLEVSMDISIPGFSKADAEALVAKTHQVCPYSNATRGNISVILNVV